jgi:hypothetical protein
MKHLSHDELLAALEDGSRAAETSPRWRLHLDACAKCRRELDELRGVLRDVASVPVPEPSPLFWDHFAARVSDAVSAEEGQPAGEGARRGDWRAWLRWQRALPLAATLVVLAIVAGTLTRPLQRATPPASTGAAPAAGAVPPPAAAPDDPAAGSEEESWSVLAAILSEADTSAVMAPTPGSAEGAMLQLSDEERGELGRLLQAEIDRHRERVSG